MWTQATSEKKRRENQGKQERLLGGNYNSSATVCDDILVVRLFKAYKLLIRRRNDTEMKKVNV